MDERQGLEASSWTLRWQFERIPVQPLIKGTLFIRNKVILRTLFIIIGNYPHCAQRSHANRTVAWPEKLGGGGHKSFRNTWSSSVETQNGAQKNSVPILRLGLWTNPWSIAYRVLSDFFIFLPFIFLSSGILCTNSSDASSLMKENFEYLWKVIFRVI